MSDAIEPTVKTNPQGDVISTTPAAVAEPTPGPRPADTQKAVTPEFLFFEAPRERKFITGSEAAKEAIRRSSVDLSIAYPITPQSEMMQQVGNLWAEGYVKDYYRGEEEYGVFSAIAGGVRAGVRCFTATAGPGTIRGLEPIASWPGHRLPCVTVFTCRVVNAPLAIQPDNIEISYLLNTGMILFHAENQQDLHDYMMKAFIIAEANDVFLPVGVCCDGFFITHARDYVWIASADYKLPPRDPHGGPVPAMDAENPPARLQRDAPVQKSNFMSYMIHASWQQEVWAANTRARKYIQRYMGGLIEVVHPEAPIKLLASGSAAGQCREAMRITREQGLDVGLVKVHSLRPWPRAELIEACRNATLIMIPEFNCIGWLSREVISTLYGQCEARIVDGPRFFGGMSMPVEVIVERMMKEAKGGLTNGA